MQRKLLALLAVLAMAAAACTTGDPSADTVPVTDTDGTTAGRLLAYTYNFLKYDYRG